MSKSWKRMDADSIGITEHLEAGISEVIDAFNEQSINKRKVGNATVTIKVTFSPTKTGAEVSVSSAVKVPDRVLDEPAPATMQNGQLMLPMIIEPPDRAEVTVHLRKVGQ
jgi:hypothetical protein